MNVIKIDNGIWIDDKRIDYLKDVKIHSSVDNISEITVTFLGKISGLDDFEDLNKK
ncbi:hypothetical protein OGZ37_06705 [Lactococcus lactis]|uniref:hypothetical protein n=1 Tax=Lactococcus lactis TaxID=1358 RepID=UPI002418AB31|nr:hypothetical protein [Lactococcus lactis]MDG4966266.1 hypothetical protein [Lactococcus lactis]